MIKKINDPMMKQRRLSLSALPCPSPEHPQFDRVLVPLNEAQEGGTSSCDEDSEGGVVSKKEGEIIVEKLKNDGESVKKVIAAKDIKQSIASSETVTHEHLEFPADLSVLVVDDQPIIRKMVRHRFKALCTAPNLNWHIYDVPNGEEMFDFMLEHPTDIIVIDNNMESAGKKMAGVAASERM
jgi:CheY-like chemotaxis protein